MAVTLVVVSVLIVRAILMMIETNNDSYGGARGHVVGLNTHLTVFLKKNILVDLVQVQVETNLSSNLGPHSVAKKYIIQWQHKGS